MASPSLTYTLTNGQPNDADEVMSNFNDLLNGITDSTKDLSISALTCAGTVTFNGNANIGNADSSAIGIDGIVTLERSNLAATSAPAVNTLYPTNLIKAWATLTASGAGTVTVTAGFNVDTASYSVEEMTVNFHTNLSDANYAVFISCIADSPDNSVSVGGYPHDKAVGSFIFDAYKRDGSSNSIASGNVFHILVIGNQ